jgi:tripartite-type tricarboxylate transporter receptor subunit TctC
MKLPRRTFLHLAVSAAAVPAVSRIARAQAYPTRPVRIIVGYAAGGPADIFVRLLAQWLSERFGQQFLIEHRPGAGSNIGTEAVVRAAPDGYTLLLVSPANAVNATLYEKLNFNFIRDIAPVAGIVRLPNVMVLHPSVAANSVPEFIDFAKANPGKLNFGAAPGTSIHLSGELFKMMAGVDIVHVSYRGAGPALTDLLSGQVQVMFNSLASSVEYIKANKLRALAVTTTMRSDLLPHTPAMAEFLPGYEVSNWYGIGAPSKVPSEVIERLNGEINSALNDTKMQALLSDFGATVIPGSAASFGKFVNDETEKWAKVVKFANLKPE